MVPLVEVKNLEVRYGSKKAVRGLSFSLMPGESVGLLGANGAGKSSTLRAILGMQPVSQGSISVFGKKPGLYKSFEQLGFAPEEGSAPEYLTGLEYLLFVSDLHRPAHPENKKEAQELLQWFELNPNQRIRDYSKGMKRRILLAQSMVASPQILILDEPLNGLDPLMIVKLRELLIRKREQGVTVLYSSHILSEVEKTCSRAIMLREGEMVLDASLPDIVRDYGGVEDAFTQKVSPL
ncbi:MAG: ABC transporter ATP-binding protein [Proteobacteria bacterium]|nr:ABC transporter ATP-binding protein [Pseudomonadota bacterium]NDC23930.1 ABC transporter ATP-binding protein [Pseudomonadota bacterium]NDD03971.1 ABC transporter ATP-binding protein [Pseudomonadota bacterium]NDG26778.1 ABC transporter ATP-binding protein [Pseudomonadota bacterium]